MRPSGHYVEGTQGQESGRRGSIPASPHNSSAAVDSYSFPKMWFSGCKIPAIAPQRAPCVHLRHTVPMHVPVTSLSNLSALQPFNGWGCRGSQG